MSAKLGRTRASTATGLVRSEFLLGMFLVGRMSVLRGVKTPSTPMCSSTRHEHPRAEEWPTAVYSAFSPPTPTSCSRHGTRLVGWAALAAAAEMFNNKWPPPRPRRRVTVPSFRAKTSDAAP